MDFTASILPFIAASICLIFSIHFLIMTLIMEGDRLFFGFFFLALVLAVSQFATAMQGHFFPIDVNRSFFWYRIQFAAFGPVIFMTVYFFNLLTNRRVNAPITYIFLSIIVGLAVSMFLPIFGRFTVIPQDVFIFVPHLGALFAMALLAGAAVYLVYVLIESLMTGRRRPKIRFSALYIASGIILFVLGVLEILMQTGVIRPTSVKYSSVAAIVLVMIGASVVFVRFYEMKTSLRRILINLSETERRLEHKERLAITDALTGLYNRGFFDESLEEEVKDSIKNNRSLSLIMLDIDEFKSINDVFGHTIGDSVLAEIASVIKRNARASDLPARYGGEEFAVILPNTTIREAHEVSERIRKTIEEIIFVVQERPDSSVTISAGVTTLKGTDLAIDLLARADKALLAAKARGKNNVYVIG
jgi:diguanylate cyclase (GGDEF)-like protein